MKICVFGAGAIGGHMGLMLKRGGKGVKTPYIDAVLALTQQMGEVAGVYPVYPAEAYQQHKPEVAASPV